MIESADGIVNKYIGDAVMAFWKGTAAAPNHALSACVAALRCQAVIDLLNRQWREQGKAPFDTRIGLNTGEVVVGNIGSDAQLNYTIIGDAVNLSSRLEGLNKLYGTAHPDQRRDLPTGGAEDRSTTPGLRRRQGSPPSRADL